MSTPHEAPAVALTEEHLKTLHSLSETLHRRSMTSAAKRIQEVAANIRSQVQGGMKLYDPTKGCVVPQHEIAHLLARVVSPHLALHESRDALASAFVHWLTPQQEPK